MRILNIIQGSPAWHAWRKTVITGTDASIILGSNPWDTPYQAWQRKLSLIGEKEETTAMKRGHDLEPEARENFIAMHGIDVLPAVVESTEYNFLGASLDGLSSNGKIVLEIKCGGEKLHFMARAGEIPEYYKDQIQHQLLVTGADCAYYYSYNGQEGISIKVLPDPSWKDDFLPKARAFWRSVALNEAPPLQDKDYKDMSQNGPWVHKAQEYRLICDELKSLEKRKEACRKDLIALSEDQSSKGAGIKVLKNTVKGQVNYDIIPELKTVDLDKYRKDSSTVWKVMIA